MIIIIFCVFFRIIFKVLRLKQNISVFAFTVEVTDLHSVWV